MRDSNYLLVFEIRTHSSRRSFMRNVIRSGEFHIFSSWLAKARWLGHLPCNSEIMGSNSTQGRIQGFGLNNIAHASVNTESLCVPISQIQ